MFNALKLAKKQAELKLLKLRLVKQEKITKKDQRELSRLGREVKALGAEIKEETEHMANVHSAEKTLDEWRRNNEKRRAGLKKQKAAQ